MLYYIYIGLILLLCVLEFIRIIIGDGGIKEWYEERKRNH